MENNESIEHVLENMDKNLVIKTKSPAYQSLLFIFTGLIIFASYTANEWPASSVMPHFLFVLGASIIVYGVLRFFLRKAYFIATENKERIRIKEIYFKYEDREKLVKIIESGNLNELGKLNISVSDGLRLRVASTVDGNICFSQVVTYIANERVNVNTVKQHSTAEAGIIHQFIQKIK